MINLHFIRGDISEGTVGELFGVCTMAHLCERAQVHVYVHVHARCLPIEPNAGVRKGIRVLFPRLASVSLMTSVTHECGRWDTSHEPGYI